MKDRTRDWYLFYCGFIAGLLIMMLILAILVPPSGTPIVRTQIVATATGAW